MHPAIHCRPGPVPTACCGRSAAPRSSPGRAQEASGPIVIFCVVVGVIMILIPVFIDKSFRHSPTCPPGQGKAFVLWNVDTASVMQSDSCGPWV